MKKLEVDGTEETLSSSVDVFANHGVLFRPLSPSDFRLGASPIVIEQRVPDFNWRGWEPEDEKQKILFETMACVSFSADNVIETQLNWLYDTRKIPQPAVDFLMNNGYYKNGKFNVSDRFIAIMSDTSENGNYLDKVDYTIRKVGLIPESMLPYGGTNQAEYLDKAVVTQAMLDLGLEFLKYFVIRYEALFYPGMYPTTLLELKKTIKEHLMHAPLHIATPTCSPWLTTEIVQACARPASHATQLSGLVWEQFFMDYDTYTPFQKRLAWDYPIPYIYKLLIDPIVANEEGVKLAQAKVKEIMIGRRAPYFQRVQKENGANGEVYEVNIDGSFKYLLGIKCPLFDSLSRNLIFTPISEALWHEIHLAEIK